MPKSTKQQIAELITIILICGGITYLMIPVEVFKNKKSTLTEVILLKITYAINSYYEKYHQLPTSSEIEIAKALTEVTPDLSENTNISAVFVDAWKNPIRITNNNGIIKLTSAGKNKIFDDKDDIEKIITNSFCLSAGVEEHSIR